MWPSASAADGHVDISLRWPYLCLGRELRESMAEAPGRQGSARTEAARHVAPGARRGQQSHLQGRAGAQPRSSLPSRAAPQCSSPPRPPFSAGLPTACASWGCSSSTGGWAHAEFPTRGPAWAEFPVMPPLLVPPRPGNPGWAVACLTGGLPRPHGHTRGPFSSPSQNLDDENSTKGR